MPVSRLVSILCAIGLVCGAGCSVDVLALRSPALTARITAAGVVQISDDQCKSLHNKVIAYNTVTAALGALSGGSGVTTAVLTSSTPRYVTGGISVGLGVFSAVFGILLKYAQDDFSAGCAIAPPATTSP